MRHAFWPAVRATLVLAFLTGLVYPLAMTAAAQLLFPDQANGSLIKDASGKVVGSSLIGQNFKDPKYFHPRPSAAGNDGYDAANSSATNLGPTSDKLINGVHKPQKDGKDDPDNFDGVTDLVKAYREENKLGDNEPVPVDAVTRSASGLDPHISPANAKLQTKRVAEARKMDPKIIEELIAKNTDPRSLGFLGEPGVNVLKLNVALDNAGKH